MAIRGEAPTVLLLATEADSEWASGGGGGGGGTGTGTGTSTSTNDPSSGKGAGGGSGHVDDRSSDEQEGGRGACLSSSSSATAASLDAVLDVGASGGARAAGTSSVGGDGAAAANDAGTGTPAPSSVRSPLPLSTFAAPSLADTDDPRDHHRRRNHLDNAATAAADAGTAVEGGAATEPAVADSLIGTSVVSKKLRAGRNSSTRSRGSRDAAATAVAAAAVPLESGRGGSFAAGGCRSNSSGSINEHHRDSSAKHNLPDGGTINNGGSGSETDYGSGGNGVCSSEGGGGIRGAREGEDNASGWEGLLEVHVRCAGSGNCPLHEAAASGSVGAVLSLLDLGADVDVANGWGDSALHVGVIILDVAKTKVCSIILAWGMSVFVFIRPALLVTQGGRGQRLHANDVR